MCSRVRCGPGRRRAGTTREPGAGGRDLLVRARADVETAHDHARRGGGARRRALAVRVESCCIATGATTSGSATGVPSTRRRGRDLGDVDEHARPELPALEGRAVRAQRPLVARAALEVAPGPGLDPLLGDPLEVVGDVDSASSSPQSSSAFAAISRSPP